MSVEWKQRRPRERRRARTSCCQLLQLAASAGEPQPPAHIAVPAAADAHHLHPEPDAVKQVLAAAEPDAVPHQLQHGVDERQQRHRDDVPNEAVADTPAPNL